MKKPKVFISGKVTGEDYQACWDKFNAVEQILNQLGFEVINPMRIVPNGTPWQDAMEICYTHQKPCNITLMLPDWKESVGSCQEHDQAIYFGHQIVHYANIYSELAESVELPSPV